MDETQETPTSDGASAARTSGSTTKIYSSDELRAMDLSNLVSHTVRLQQVYEQLESECRVLGWEFHEIQDNFTHFSRAIKLAHRLSASDIETVASLAINEIPVYFNCRFAALFLYDSDTRLLKLHRATLPPPETAPLHGDHDREHFLVKLFSQQPGTCIVEYDTDERVLVSDDMRISARVPEKWIERLGGSALVFPLRVQQTDRGEWLFLGGLIIGDTQQGLEAKDADVATIFADLLSSSLHNARLVQKLNDLTIIEPLTGVYNRRHFVEQLTGAMTRSRRHNHDLALLMLDIDNFKILNDRHGHLAGDEVLRDVAALIKRSIRTDVDIPARYGGEEFVVIMPCTGLEQARIVAERIREKIGGQTSLFDGKKLSVTCSLGIAIHTRAESMERFIERADLALYQAKREGRDRVCVGSAETPPRS